MKIYFSKKSLEYNSPGHPESGARIINIKTFLEKRHYSFVQPTSCTEKDILRVHSQDHLDAVKTGFFFDPDTPSLPRIYDYAVLAAGAAINALQSAWQEEIAFSLMRPPGHHASQDRIMGFCYFNNLAIATAFFLENNPDKKVAILDIDVHHGNGTEEIFRNNKNVLYVSLHQYPLFPGTGRKSGQNFVNFPLPPGTEETAYMDTLEIACDHIAKFNPSLMGISLGLDTLYCDPLSIFNLTPDSYTKIAAHIALLKKPAFIIMEGGYSEEIALSTYNFLKNIEL